MTIFDFSINKDIVHLVKIGDFITGASLFQILNLEKTLVKRIPTAKILFTDTGNAYVSRAW